MKIAVLSSHTPSLFWFRMDMMKAFQALGHTVIAIGNESADIWQAKFEEDDIAYREIRVNRNGTNPFYDFQTLKSIKKVLAQVKPDKIFSYQAKTIIYGGIAAKQLGIKDVYPLIAGVGSVFLGQGFKNAVMQFILATEYKLSLRNSIKVFFQNQDDSKLFLNKRLLSPEKVVFINGSGINTNKFQPSSLPEEVAFLCISRLIKDKGVGEYLEACQIIKQRHQDVRCMLVGPFDTNPSALRQEELQTYINSGVIEYLGEQSDVRPCLTQCSVFVLPSYHEGTPKTVLEAMACGRAIITTDAPGCRETVINGENGYLVPVKDVNALTEKMEHLLDKSELIRQMGIKGREIAVNKYDVALVNAQIIKTMKL